MQYVSGQGLVTACLDALMTNVNIPKGYAFLYTDVFGYDGCLAQAVLQSSVQDPGTARSCVTICHDMESQLYITRQVGTAVFTMANAKELDIPGFPDLQKVVDMHTVVDPRLSMQLEATVYLAEPRVLAVMERHINRWTSDPINGDEPQA